MLTKEEVFHLRYNKESSRVERTTSTGDMDKFQEAICAFSNDMANSRKPGYLLIGVKDNGDLSGLKVDDKLFIKISSIRSSGNILPIPTMTTEAYEFDDGDVLVVEVLPSLTPPVRYRGRIFIRIGPRRDIASEAEERILIERRMANMPSFDTTPCYHASLKDINVETFKNAFLIHAVSEDELENDERTIQEQMAAVGMFDLENNCPTYGAIALFGYKPRRFMPGLYVQYVKFKGLDKTSDIEDERQFEGGYVDLMSRLENFIEWTIVKRRPVPVSVLREELVYNYPYRALRELCLNSLIHRDMQGHGPIRIYEYEDRIEIMNPGGLYGNARPENFPKVNDYRNPLIASSFKSLGYVNMFNRGISEVQRQLVANGNKEAIFNVSNITAFEVTVCSRSQDQAPSQGHQALSQGTSQGDQGTSQGHQALSQGTSQGHQALSQGTSQGDQGTSQGHQALSQGTSQGDQAPSQGTSQDKVTLKILEFCKEAKSLSEIMTELGYQDRGKFRIKYINPLLANGKLKRTIPDKPKSSKQKYISIAPSKEF